MADVDRDILNAIDALKESELLLIQIERLRKQLIDTMYQFEQLITRVPQAQLDLRMARMRLTAQLSSDPDKTPVEHKGSYTNLRLDPGKKPGQ